MISKSLVSLALLIATCAVCTVPARAQGCTPPPVTVNSNARNIFSPEQEMILGELNYQRMSRDLRFVKNSELNAYVNAIGEKLIRHLPQTGLKFQFHIVDLPEANAFNTPGGYVFLSRKLIGFVHNEDELAGVMAHELGHAVVRHGTIDFSSLFKEILNVTEVGDRKDIAEKYNLFLERYRMRRIPERKGHESEQQLEADRIGLFAMVAAGYDPGMFASFFDRLVETKGKTGNWFSDIFGRPKPDEKRLREMIKVTEQLPAQCRESRTVEASAEFLNWQADVISFRESDRKEELPGLAWKKSLSPKLRSDISHVAFSPDGSYFLAQDDFAITLATRAPLKVLFQIPATDARDAVFTPDNKFIVFSTENLRYEKWSVAEAKPVEIRELVVRRDCLENRLSSDGRYLACVDYETNLIVLDTKTGEKIWEKKEFYRLSFFEYLIWMAAMVREDSDTDVRLFNIEFSPDSRVLAVSRSNKSRFTFRIDTMVADSSEDTLVALDLNTLKPIKTGGDLKQATRRPFLFLDSNRILAMGLRRLEDGGIFSFPEGKRLAKFALGGEELERTANPNYVVVRPAGNARLAIYDLKRNTLVGGFDKSDVAFWNDVTVYESVSGRLLLADTKFDETSQALQNSNVQMLDLPVSPVGALGVSELSDSFQWLAVSSKSRGAIWDLTSGDQKLFVRGFRGAVMANSGAGIGDFPKLSPLNHSLVLFNSAAGKIDLLREIPETGTTQHGQFLLTRTSLKSQTNSEKNEAGAKAQSPDKPSEKPLGREVKFELSNLVQDKVIWSREFPKEAPRYFFDEFSGRLIFYWTLGSEVGKARLKDDPVLAAKVKELGNKDDDYLLEVIDAFAGKTVGTMLIETGKGSFDIKSGFSEKDWLIFQDSQNRILAYSIKDGELRHRFFGGRVAINPSRSQLLVENYPGELTLYDLTSGESKSRMVIGSPAVFTRFSVDGKRLFVLSAEQDAYAFDVEKFASQTAFAAK